MNDEKFSKSMDNNMNSIEQYFYLVEDQIEDCQPRNCLLLSGISMQTIIKWLKTMICFCFDVLKIKEKICRHAFG